MIKHENPKLDLIKWTSNLCNWIWNNPLTSYNHKLHQKFTIITQISLNESILASTSHDQVQTLTQNFNISKHEKNYILALILIKLTIIETKTHPKNSKKIKIEWGFLYVLMLEYKGFWWLIWSRGVARRCRSPVDGAGWLDGSRKCCGVAL